MSASPSFIPAEEVERLLRYDELLPILEAAFGSYSQGKDGGVVQPVRQAVLVNKYKGLLGVMPALSLNDNALATKLVTVYPENHSRYNLPSHQAVIILFNPENGSIQAVMDGEVITGIRTAVASAVATKHLANINSKVLAILGTGVQARCHYKAMKLLHNFEEVRIWGRNFANAEKLAKELGARACRTGQEAVNGADIICTVTCSTTPVLQASWVKDGAHINAVGSCRKDWQEIDADLMRSAIIYTDSVEGALKESGDILMADAKIYAEIGEVINKTKEAFRGKTTLFESLGMAVEDVVTSKLIYDKHSRSSKY